MNPQCFLPDFSMSVCRSSLSFSLPADLRCIQINSAVSRPKRPTHPHLPLSTPEQGWTRPSNDMPHLQPRGASSPLSGGHLLLYPLHPHISISNLYEALIVLCSSVEKQHSSLPKWIQTNHCGAMTVPFCQNFLVIRGHDQSFLGLWNSRSEEGRSSLVCSTSGRELGENHQNAFVAGFMYDHVRALLP